MFALSFSGFLTFLSSSIFLVGYISNNSLFPEPLDSEEEKKYLELLKNGDEDARNILIERNLRLVAHVCKKYATSKVDQDDLISIGTIGLIKGINSFDNSKGVRLATYVSRCIDNEILMYLRSTKKLGAEVYLEDPIGKDKDDNTVTLQEVFENSDKNIEDEVDLKLKFGLNGNKPQTQNEIASNMGISRSYVSRIETKAINKLAKEMREAKV